MTKDLSLGDEAVVAVVVTRHRRELLADSLKVIAAQTRPPDHVIVVDNGPDQPARDVVAACAVPTTYLPSRHNLGGAGGFALGMLHALALGAAWVWLADDDGRPADDSVLATLLEEAQRRQLAAVSPMVTDINAPDRLAFPLRRGLTWKRQTAELGTDFLPGIASLFNGALFRASTLDVVGVPDYHIGDWCVPGCRSARLCGPAICIRMARPSSSQCSVAGSTLRILAMRSSGITRIGTAVICCRSRGCGGSGRWRLFGSGCIFLGCGAILGRFWSGCGWFGRGGGSCSSASSLSLFGAARFGYGALLSPIHSRTNKSRPPTEAPLSPPEDLA